MTASGSQPSPTSLLDRAKGASLTNIATTGLGAWLLALITSAITGVQAVVDVLLVPIEVLFTSSDSLVRSSVEAFLIDPLSIIDSGATASATGASEFGVFGLIVSVAIVLASIFLVVQFVRENETANIPAPGLATDVPFIGAEEEAPDEEDI